MNGQLRLLGDCHCLREASSGRSLCSGQLRLAHVRRARTHSWVPGAWGASRLLTLASEILATNPPLHRLLQIRSPFAPQSTPPPQARLVPDIVHCALNGLPSLGSSPILYSAAFTQHLLQEEPAFPLGTGWALPVRNCLLHLWLTKQNKTKQTNKQKATQ